MTLIGTSLPGTFCFNLTMGLGKGQTDIQLSAFWSALDCPLVGALRQFLTCGQLTGRLWEYVHDSVLPTACLWRQLLRIMNIFLSACSNVAYSQKKQRDPYD